MPEQTRNGRGEIATEAGSTYKLFIQQTALDSFKKLLAARYPNNALPAAIGPTREPGFGRCWDRDNVLAALPLIHPFVLKHLGLDRPDTLKDHHLPCSGSQFFLETIRANLKAQDDPHNRWRLQHAHEHLQSFPALPGYFVLPNDIAPAIVRHPDLTPDFNWNNVQLGSYHLVAIAFARGVKSGLPVFEPLGKDSRLPGQIIQDIITFNTQISMDTVVTASGWEHGVGKASVSDMMIGEEGCLQAADIVCDVTKDSKSHGEATYPVTIDTDKLLRAKDSLAVKPYHFPFDFTDTQGHEEPGDLQSIIWANLTTDQSERAQRRMVAAMNTYGGMMGPFGGKRYEGDPHFGTITERGNPAFQSAYWTLALSEWGTRMGTLAATAYGQNQTEEGDYYLNEGIKCLRRIQEIRQAHGGLWELFAKHIPTGQWFHNANELTWTLGSSILTCGTLAEALTQQETCFNQSTLRSITDN